MWIRAAAHSTTPQAAIGDGPTRCPRRRSGAAWLACPRPVRLPIRHQTLLRPSPHGHLLSIKFKSSRNTASRPGRVSGAATDSPHLRWRRHTPNTGGPGLGPAGCTRSWGLSQGTPGTRSARDPYELEGVKLRRLRQGHIPAYRNEYGDAANRNLDSAGRALVCIPIHYLSLFHTQVAEFRGFCSTSKPTGAHVVLRQASALGLRFRPRTRAEPPIRCAPDRSQCIATVRCAPGRSAAATGLPVSNSTDEN